MCFSAHPSPSNILVSFEAKVSKGMLYAIGQQFKANFSQNNAQLRYTSIHPLCLATATLSRCVCASAWRRSSPLPCWRRFPIPWSSMAWDYQHLRPCWHLRSPWFIWSTSGIHGICLAGSTTYSYRLLSKSAQLSELHRCHCTTNTGFLTSSPRRSSQSIGT